MQTKVLVSNDPRDWRHHPDNPRSFRFRELVARKPIEQARWWVNYHKRGPVQRAVLDDERVFRDLEPW